MRKREALFFFDYLDPFSYLEELDLVALQEAGGLPVRRVPLELRPPPAPLLDPDAEAWVRLWREASAVAAERGIRLTPPRLVPWTRKAHELVLHAAEKGLARAVHQAVFRAVFDDGADVGRVDVLVDIAESLGLDPTETKATLDVDRYAASVEDLRDLAAASGITAPPALLRDGRALRGFHNTDALRTFLRSP